MKLFYYVSLLLVSFISQAQEKHNYKFGNVSPEDFKRNIYSIDSNAAAVVLADIGSSAIEGNTKGSFSIIFRNYRRAHILNKTGYDISNVSIPLYKSGQMEEKIESLKAVTYNLENGKVVETKLDVKSAVFKDVINDKWVVRKFTFPNVKEGSIIEYEYKVQSDFYHNLQGWSFQGEYPVLWSEYKVAIPSFLTYLTLFQGNQQFIVREQKSTHENFSMADGHGIGRTERISFNADVNNYRWAMQDVPALKEESYTSTIKNYVSKLQFQLSSFGYPFEPRQVMNTWPTVTKSLLEDEDFGAHLTKDNGWLTDALEDVIQGTTDPMEKAHKIYYWVRDQFTCTERNRIYMNTTLKNVFKNKNGSEAEINLLLTAMLKKSGFIADPLLLSTRSHGFVHPIYPIMERFNYVISRLEIDGKTYYLDASQPLMGFGRLDHECYNGHAFIINPEATPTRLDAKEIREESNTMIFLVNDDEGNLIGSLKYTPGYVEATRIRKEIKEKGMDVYQENLKKKHGNDFEVSKLQIDSLKNYDETITISHNIDFKGEKEDIIYFNPMFDKGYKENPFKSAKRHYPVEIPFTMDETFNLQMDVPAGYEIDELPKQAIVKFNEENDAYFEYRISKSGNMIFLRSRLKIEKTHFVPEDYEILREFFSLVVMKHNEQIVFKKKK